MQLRLEHVSLHEHLLQTDRIRRAFSHTDAAIYALVAIDMGFVSAEADRLYGAYFHAGSAARTEFFIHFGCHWRYSLSFSSCWIRC